MQEGHVLERRRASSATLKSMYYEQEGRKKLTRGEGGCGDLPQPLRRRGAQPCHEKVHDICFSGYEICCYLQAALRLNTKQLVST